MKLLKLNILPIFIVTLCAISCQQKINTTTADDQTTKKIIINSSGTSTNIAADLFESVTYTPLETTKLSVFGKISQLEISDQFFIILDRITSGILLFDKQGKFHVRIQGRRIDEFSINNTRKEIYFQDLNKPNSFLTYNFDGRLVRSEVLPSGFKSMAAIGYEARVFYSSFRSHPRLNSKVQYSNLVVFKDWNILAHYLPFDSTIRRSNLYNIEKNFFLSDQKTYFTEDYNYNVFLIKESGLFKDYEVMIPDSNQLPPNFLISKTYGGDSRKFIVSNKKIVYAISNFYEVNTNNVFFSLMRSGGQDNYIYNSSKSNLINFNKIISDKSIYMLPFGFNIHGVKEGFAYSVLPSTILYRSIGRIKRDYKNVKMPDYINEFARSWTNRDNPVIVNIKLK